MARKAKVVLTDYVWGSLDVERKTLDDLADLVPLQTKKPEEFLPQASDCDALLTIEMRIVPPAGVKRNAFSTRLLTARPNNIESAQTFPSPEQAIVACCSSATGS